MRYLSIRQICDLAGTRGSNGQTTDLFMIEWLKEQGLVSGWHVHIFFPSCHAWQPTVSNFARVLFQDFGPGKKGGHGQFTQSSGPTLRSFSPFGV